jgi:oligoribonuclease NrnB/cAMP/cGMP phosphodiesterase (DHH superfamily)
MIKICIYHGNCADGFGAAWVVRKALGDIEFHAATHGNNPPDLHGKDVIVVDFSYKKDMLAILAAEAKSILIIDHHKTAAEDLVDLPANVTTIFDMDHSGAVLTWMHFYPGIVPPQLLLHIEDRDLWRFALEGTRQIQANVFSYPYDFAVWDDLMLREAATLAIEGAAIERKHFKDIAELLPVVTRKMNIAGYIVSVANLPYIFSSDAGHELALGNPFGACYSDTPDGRVFSLRSSDAGIDVSAIAKQYGGGGHRNAAGFRVDYATAALFEFK